MPGDTRSSTCIEQTSKVSEGGKKRRLGTFATAEEAARAYATQVGKERSAAEAAAARIAVAVAVAVAVVTPEQPLRRTQSRGSTTQD